MTRLVFPDEGSRLVYRIFGAAMFGSPGASVLLYTDPGATVLADLRAHDGTSTPGAIISDSSITIDAHSRIPLFWGPDNVDTLYATVNGGPISPVYARVDDRIEAEIIARSEGDSTTAALVEAEFTARTTAANLALSAANLAYASRYITASTYANTARLMQKLKRNVSDAQMLFIGDSTGNATDEWIYLTTVALAARFPAYTVTYTPWDETTNTAYLGTTTVQTGTGVNTLRVYNVSKAGETAGYVLGSRWLTAVVPLDPDLIWISHGHNHFDPTNMTFAPQIQRNQYLPLTEELSALFPTAGIILIAQNPSLITGRETWQAHRANTISEIVALRDYGFVDIHQAFIDNGNIASLMADTTHPNSAGSALWAAVAGAALTDATGSVSRSSRSLLLSQGRNLLTNSDFTDWAGTDPVGWVPTLATTSKDTTNFETGTYGCKITATSGSGSAYIDQTINLTTAGMRHLRGQLVTVAIRVYIPTSNTAFVSAYLQDSTGGANSRRSDSFASARDRFMWIFATKRISDTATTLTVRAIARTAGTAVVECTVDRIYLTRGILPECG